MKFKIKKIAALLCCMFAVSAYAQTNDAVEAGPLYARFPLTLSSGYRTEAVGPLYYSQEVGSQDQWALPPFFCYTRTPDVDWTEWEFLYPVVDYRRFGPEYRLQIMEFFSFSGGPEPSQTDIHHFTLFPIYFQQRATDTNLNYTAVVPFYGHLVNRLFRDDIKFIMFPLYSETRKKDVVTDNYLCPIFDLRHGNQLTGWQFWPLVGVEHKAPTLMTNEWKDVSTNGGYDKFFALWPFYFKSRNGLGTTNPSTSLTVVPFYDHGKSTIREQTSYGWPLGYNVIDDHEQGYSERDLFYPFIVNAHGSKTVHRVFPFYSRAHNKDIESDFYLWPVYKVNRLHAPPLDRERTRILFFLYSDIHETNSESGSWTRRADFWPFYTYHRDADGSQRLQALTILEPIFPNNRSITREYSQVWALWRNEKNARTRASSQSLLWNLYRREASPDEKKISLLFGLIQYQTNADGRRWRLCHITVAGKSSRTTGPKL